MFHSYFQGSNLSIISVAINSKTANYTINKPFFPENRLIVNVAPGAYCGKIREKEGAYWIISLTKDWALN